MNNRCIDFSVFPEYLDERVNENRKRMRSNGFQPGHFQVIGKDGEGLLRIRIPAIQDGAPTEEDFIKSTLDPEGIYNAFMADPRYRGCTIGRPETIVVMANNEILTRIKITYPQKETDFRRSR